MAGPTPLRLGTRGSLLAVAQSRLVAAALRRADPGLQVILRTVTTRGDADRHTPLDQVDDPGFFSDELDDALRRGDVDCCVHSVKDLPLAPRADIVTAAVPPREDPRDVVVFRATVLDRLRTGRPLRIGSSSARRALHVQPFLAEALPRLAERPPRLAFQPLRGPVEARVGRIALPEDADGALDGVVLALAGLQRLWSDRGGHAALAPLLADARLMVLPLTRCPAAPGQGALAVECRADDARTREALAVLDDAATRRRVRRELDLLAARPVAERPAFAATTVHHPACGSLLFVQTGGGAGRPATVAWRRPPSPAANARAWDGGEWVRATPVRSLPVAWPPATAVFAAHWRAVTAWTRPGEARLWVSGVGSWLRLASRGLWVEGCADNLGFESVVPTLQLPVLRLPALRDWVALTREDAVPSWAGSGVGTVVASYAVGAPGDATLADLRATLSRATHFYWGSAAQYEAVRAWLPPRASHACGPGKTWHALRAAGVADVHAFPSRSEWQRWLA